MEKIRWSLGSFLILVLLFSSSCKSGGSGSVTGGGSPPVVQVMNLPPVLSSFSPGGAASDVPFMEEDMPAWQITVTDPENGVLRYQWSVESFDQPANKVSLIQDTSTVALSDFYSAMQALDVVDIILKVKVLDDQDQSLTVSWRVNYETPAVYASDLIGDDNATGLLPWVPVKTVAKAITVAQAQGRSRIYLAGGSYRLNAGFQMANGVSIYGSRSSVYFHHPVDASFVASVLSTDRLGILFRNIINATTLANVWILSDNATTAGATSYAIRILNSQNVTVTQNQMASGNGANGSNGANGARGSDGANGSDGQAGVADSIVVTTGGAGGVSICGDANSTGGRGGTGGSDITAGNPGETKLDVTGGAGGNASVDAFTRAGSGQDGQNGYTRFVDGRPGSQGQALGAFVGAQLEWAPTAGGIGQTGSSGLGGGGGGGGGGGMFNVFFNQADTGGAGGGGGAGGCGGEGGTPGQGGGSSIGILVAGTSTNSIRITENLIETHLGGKGGNGGEGGRGGNGGNGGIGGDAADLGGLGGLGGRGGSGQTGGSGANGVGGSSIAVMISQDSATTEIGNIIALSIPGAGGRNVGAIPGENGVSDTHLVVPSR